MSHDGTGAGRWTDASLPISGRSLVWPGDEPVRVEPTVRIAAGDDCNESRIEIGSHCTTHIDAPYHFDDHGLRIDQVGPDVLMGPAWVVDSAEPKLIGVDAVRAIPDAQVARVLFKTRNGAFLDVPPFREDYVGLATDAARDLVERGCRLVGIDYCSICPYEDLISTHRMLLCNGVVIIESLVLDDVPAGPVDLIALPLRIAGGDASPARVLIRARL